MALGLRLPTTTITCLALTLALASACGGGSKPSAVDQNHDNVADDLGKTIDQNGDGLADGIDINHDGVIDGPGVDTDHDGKVDALALDTDCDGIFDSLDTTGDGAADFVTSLQTPAEDVAGCKPVVLGGGNGGNGGGANAGGGSGGAPGAGGKAGGKGGGSANGGGGGAVNSGGSASTGGSGGKGGGAGGSSSAGGAAPSQLGKGTYQGTGDSTDQYAESDIYRNGVGYKFIANGWGSGWQSQQISWNGTSFKVAKLNGSQGANYSPAGYPTVFCGLYSQKPSVGTCGLPASTSALKSINTGWRWKANGNGGQYNAAWDIWLGNGNSLSAYLMVWLRDPPGQQPAGSATTSGATIAGLPGSWSIWTGNVNGHPIVSYVQAEGQDLGELEYDVMNVYRDAMKRNFNLPGSQILAVAVGFEVWNGPIANLVTDDFYVDVK
jgi:hypothetical protein